MNRLISDLRYAVRMLAKTPGYTAVALVTLALAIGANTAIFSVVNSLLIQPLPFSEPEELVQLQRYFPQEGQQGGSLSIPKYVYWQERGGGVFESVTAYDNLGSGFNLVGDGTPERVIGSRVTHEFLSVFGVEPAIGRDFLPEEDRPGAGRVVILGHSLWRNRFGADRSLIGRVVVLNGEPYTVVGVAPEWFRYPAKVELWTPFAMDRASQDKGHYFEATARLRDGVTLEQAKAAMGVLGRQFIASHPDHGPEGETATLETLRDRLYGPLRPVLLVLLGAVGFVLLIACVNLANLQLARAAARQREIAIRTVLGARASQIVRQLLTESLLLAVTGGLLGTLLGFASLRPLMALSPAQIDLLVPVGIDGTVLGFTLLMSVAAGLLFGLAPAFLATRVNLNEPLKEGTTRSTGGRGGLWTRRLLVISEVALALVPLTGAALLVKSFSGLVATDPGFESERVLTMKLSLPEGRYADADALERFSRAVSERVESLPGVERAAMGTSLPLEGGADMVFTVEGKYKGDPKSQVGIGNAQYRPVAAGFLEALRVGMVRGRGIAPQDGPHAPPVVVVNETLAKEHWPNEDPIGKRIHIGLPFIPELADATPRVVVGVVEDVREVGLGEKIQPVLYVPYTQVPQSLQTMLIRLIPATLIVKAERNPEGLAAQVQKEIWKIDPQQPVNDVRPMEEIVSRSVGAQRFSALLLAILALLALALAAVGIYGVLSYLVNQRSREIGVRMALGASAFDVLGMVVRQGFGSVLVGVGAGLLGAFLLARWLGGRMDVLLGGVSATDPLSFVVAPVLLAAVALLASAIPAHRASHLDPLVALRRD